MNRFRAIFIIVSCLPTVALSQSPSPVDYKELNNAQKSCNSAVWKQVKWEPTYVDNGGIVELNPYGLWTVFDSLRVTSSLIKVNTKKKYSEQNFVVSGKRLGAFTCQEGTPLSTFDPKPSKSTWTVQTSVRHESGYQAIVAPTSELKFESSESKRPIDGWKCYSEYTDFLRNPEVVDVEKLCAGQSEAKKQEVKNEILRVADVLREKRYAECKKKKPHLAALPAGGKAWIDGPANVRMKNSSTSAIVMDLADDAQVDIVQQKGSWFLIKSDGKQGWTAKQNLLPQSIRAECRDWEHPQ